jgi:hypothetical protein
MTLTSQPKATPNLTAMWPRPPRPTCNKIDSSSSSSSSEQRRMRYATLKHMYNNGASSPEYLV